MEILLSILLSVFICYGITNIIVNGTIFEDIKGWITQKISTLEESLTFSFEDGIPDIKLFLNKKKAKKILNMFQLAEQELKDASDEDGAIEKLQTYKVDIETLFFLEMNVKKHKLFVYKKLNKLINCMMCSGFWVGLFLTIIIYCSNINLFGMQMILISKNISIFSWCISVFLLSCMFSGTSWFLGVISSFLGDGGTPSRIIHKFEHKDD